MACVFTFVYRYYLQTLLIMSYSLDEKQSALLQECISMARDPRLQADAERKFLDLEETLTSQEAAVALVGALWREVLAARRSEAFWQQISDVERSMTERITDDHFQLQRNYLRLMEEQ